MFGLNPLQFLFRVLAGADRPGEVAGGLALGFFIGLTPGWPLHILLACLLLLVFNVNLSAAFLAAAFAVGLSWLLDPVINALGSLLLEDIAALHGLWTWAYNNPLVAWTRFNNTMVMGALALGGLISLLIAVFGTQILVRYQSVWLEQLKQHRLFRLLMKSRIGQLYYWLSGGIS